MGHFTDNRCSFIFIYVHLVGKTCFLWDQCKSLNQHTETVLSSTVFLKKKTVGASSCSPTIIGFLTPCVVNCAVKAPSSASQLSTSSESILRPNRHLIRHWLIRRHPSSSSYLRFGSGLLWNSQLIHIKQLGLVCN